jgi:Cytochrome c, mono- and diheme variants
MPWFIALSVVFFVAMVSAVLVFGKEKAGAGIGRHADDNRGDNDVGDDTSAAPSIQGNPVAGKAVFASAGCVSCHTLKAAGSTGTIGPNLDQLKPPYDRIVHQVEVGGGPMPAFKGQLTDAQIHDVAAFVYTSTHP